MMKFKSLEALVGKKITSIKRGDNGDEGFIIELDSGDTLAVAFSWLEGNIFLNGDIVDTEEASA